jgi:hypothetical protein
LVNPNGLYGKFVSFIKSPVTEMVLAAAIDLSRNFLFSFVYQYIGDQLVYSIIQYLIILIPWIMLGHGALRYPQKTSKQNLDINYNNSSILSKGKNLNLLPLIFTFSILIKLFTF